MRENNTQKKKKIVTTVTKKLGEWTQEQLTNAMNAVCKGEMSERAASKTFSIPRQTLRNHLSSGNPNKIKGRLPTLSISQEQELCKRIHRLADVGMPITPKIVKRTVYNFCCLNNIKNPFNKISGMAGRKWLHLFLKRHPDVAPRKSQNLNPARAQKLNRFIVNDYFEKLKTVMTDLDLMQKPQSIYNIDEKSNRLCLHKAPVVLARKGAKRVHNIASEHGENVTIVSCGNALGHMIPPTILFKGERLRPEWCENLPIGSQVFMTPKGSMNVQTFVKWIDHFAKFKSPGPVLLIFDGVSAHLDANIVHAAEAHDITLFCLPSNTTHELQPMDNSVFKSYEVAWDEEVLLFWTQQARRSKSEAEGVCTNRTIRRSQFGKIFSRAWGKAATPSNVISGFRATGIFPFDPYAIKDEAFAPSDLTYKLTPERIETEKRASIQVSLEQVGSDEVKTVTPKQKKIPGNRSLLSRRQDDSSGSNSDYSVHDSSSDMNCSSDSELDEPAVSPTFTDILRTPEAPAKKSGKARKKALNYRAQKVVTSLFNSKIVSTKKHGKKKEKKVKPQEPVVDETQPSTSGRLLATKKNNESWYCHLCKLDRVSDMRLCNQCIRYVHEDCEGLSKDDEILNFLCSFCRESD